MKEEKLSCVVDCGGLTIVKDARLIVDEKWNRLELKVDDVTFQVALDKVKEAMKTT